MTCTNTCQVTEEHELVPFHQFAETFRPPNLYSDKFDAGDVRSYKTVVDENGLNVAAGEAPAALSPRETVRMRDPEKSEREREREREGGRERGGQRHSGRHGGTPRGRRCDDVLTVHPRHPY